MFESGEMKFNAVSNLYPVLKDFRVRESQNSVAVAFHKLGTNKVLFLLLFVNIAIELNDEHVLMTIEIGDIKLGKHRI